MQHCASVKQSPLAQGISQERFKIIKAQKILFVTATDKAGNTSSVKTVTVADKTAPGKLTVNTVKTKTTKVTGKQKPNPTPFYALNQLEKSSALPKQRVKANSRSEFLSNSGKYLPSPKIKQQFKCVKVLLKNDQNIIFEYVKPLSESRRLFYV